MKVLFVMHYPGYLRYYDTVVRGLAERGHEVVLTWELPRKQAEGRVALEGARGRITEEARMPGRKDSWKPVARHLRRVTDFVRYLDPAFRDAGYLRDRAGEVLPPGTRWLRRWSTLPARQVKALLRWLLAVERMIPPAPNIQLWLRNVAPDVIVLSPLITDASQMNDLHRAARSCGIPVVMGVASWDHLTTKGMIRHQPDRVLLWNETQRREAEQLHGVPPDRIEITGAQPFDRWFGRAPSRDRRAFAECVGLQGEGPFVLFVGSTASISSSDAEVAFVRRWIRALRESGDPRLVHLSVLIRPHPYNPGVWAQTPLSGLGDVSVWPRDGANIVDPENRDDYFDSLSYAAAVVGINTSALIEASIVGRPTLTIRASEFESTQGGTLHFRYLQPENGGPLSVADSMAEHLDQLSAAIADPAPAEGLGRRFVSEFVRPLGLDVPATPIVVDAIERAAHMRPAPAGKPSLTARPLLAVAWIAGVGMSLVDPADRAKLRRVASWEARYRLGRAAAVAQRQRSGLADTLRHLHNRERG